MSKYLYSIVAVVLMSTACVKDNVATEDASQHQNSEVVIPKGANQGEVIIKFKPEMESILDQTLTRSGGEATRSGIPSTDEVLDILGAYSFERVFPVDARHEARTREES